MSDNQIDFAIVIRQKPEGEKTEKGSIGYGTLPLTPE